MTILTLTPDQWFELGISLLILLAAWLVGRPLADFLLRRVISGIANRTSTGLDDALIEALRPPAIALLIVLAFQYAVERISFLPFDWQRTLARMLYLLYALLAFVAMGRLINSLSTWYRVEIAPKTETKLDEQLMPFMRRVAHILLALIMLIIVLSRFEVDVTGLVTTLGVGSLALALAAQETLSDTLAGFVIMVDRPFRIGDRIELQDLATWGDVVDIGLRSSRIRTRDNRMVIVPNSVIGKSLIVNHSYPDTQYRIQIHVGVAYGTDLEFARQTLIDAVRGVEGVVEDRPVEALFLEFGDSALIFRVRWWIESYVDTRIMFDRVNSSIYAALNSAGISIPYPQQDVHLIQAG